MDKRFDKEYRTQWVDEMKWLKDHGILYAFVKDIDGITTYKYTKNAKLFRSLAEFYENR